MLTPLLLVALNVGAVSIQISSPLPIGWSLEQVGQRCPEFVDEGQRVEVTRCAVRESGEFANLDGDVYFYALYCVEEKGLLLGRCDDPSRPSGRGIPGAAVFVRGSGASTFRLVTSRILPGGQLRRPAIVTSPYGAIMELPQVLAATCECNGSVYYVWQAQTRQWQETDFTAWQEDLRTRLPEGLQVWNAPWPDLRTMTVSGALWRRDDGHCCPTGGEFTGTLAIVKSQFTLSSVRFVVQTSPADPDKR